jgi:hypothetical protein
MRTLVGVGLAIVVLAACGETDTRAAALATATCTGAVHDELDLPDGEPVRSQDVTVQRDADEQRVTGLWEAAVGAGFGEFTCVVVPDDSDELRGLRVTDLEVRRGRAPGA